MATSTQLVVIGAGPGGYAAAFFAADLGMQVTLVDPEANPGGVCLYRGCIPSKALLHVAKVMSEAKHAPAWGVTFGEPTVDLDKLRAKITAQETELSQAKTAASTALTEAATTKAELQRLQQLQARPLIGGALDRKK